MEKLTDSRMRALIATHKGLVFNRFDVNGNVFVVPKGVSPRVCRDLQREGFIQDKPGQEGHSFQQQLTVDALALWKEINVAESI